jgi:hypothetical protein
MILGEMIDVRVRNEVFAYWTAAHASSAHKKATDGLFQSIQHTALKTSSAHSV